MLLQDGFHDLQRLGAINLAAIDEFKEQSERKTYLDAQFKDLTEALETLERPLEPESNDMLNTLLASDRNAARFSACSAAARAACSRISSRSCFSSAFRSVMSRIAPTRTLVPL